MEVLRPSESNDGQKTSAEYYGILLTPCAENVEVSAYKKQIQSALSKRMRTWRENNLQSCGESEGGGTQD